MKSISCKFILLSLRNFFPSKEPRNDCIMEIYRISQITRDYSARIAEYKMEAGMDEEHVVLKQSDVRMYA